MAITRTEMCVVISAAHLVGLYNAPDEGNKDALLKLTQVARLHHSLQTRHPRASLLGQLHTGNTYTAHYDTNWYIEVCGVLSVVTLHYKV